jgi:hypothetical protein
MDTMSVEKAERAIKEIRMKDGDLDGYIAKFKQLARISGHDLNAKGTWTMFTEGLPKMLHYNMISQGGRCPTSWQEWTEGAVEQQQKWLYLQTFFNGKVPQNKQGPNQNWQQGQGSGSVKNSNAMDLTLGHIRARGMLTEDEHAKLMATGGCFCCRKQGHMNRNCLDKPRQSQARGNHKDKVQIQATNTSKQLFDAKGLIEQIKELNDEDKDIYSHPRSLHEEQSGFFLSSNPSAWGQAIRRLQCNSVYLTCYRSMKIPFILHITRNGQQKYTSGLWSH